jgi:hypothetical protein
MSQASPYQPILLRVLHSLIALLVLAALVSGFWVYNTYDRRWGGLALPKLEDIQGIHGTIALTFLLLLPVFAIYSFHLGYRRLVQAESLANLKQPGRPIWWIALHRLANTLMLLAAAIAVITGRMMKEEWLPAGELNHQAYLAHLGAWGLMIFSIAMHVLLGAKVGGMPLLASVLKWQVRPEDTPRSWLQGLIIKQPSLIVGLIEIVVIGGIILAFTLPAFGS